MLIIGYVNNGVTYMATDTRLVDDRRKHNEVCECNFKLRRLANGIIYGAPQDKYIRQFLRMHEDLFTLDARGNLTAKHITTEILPALYFTMKEANLLNNEQDEKPSFPSEILIGFKGKLFGIGWNFSVTRFGTYQAVGEFAESALGLLANIDKSRDISEQLVAVIRGCTKVTEHIGGPYLTIDTDKLEYKLWEEK